MTKTISITLPQDMFNRLEKMKRERGGERSALIQRALTYYLAAEGPDAETVAAWKGAYARAARLEADSAAAWQAAQARALGAP